MWEHKRYEEIQNIRISYQSFQVGVVRGLRVEWRFGNKFSLRAVFGAVALSFIVLDKVISNNSNSNSFHSLVIQTIEPEHKLQ